MTKSSLLLKSFLLEFLQDPNTAVSDPSVYGFTSSTIQRLKGISQLEKERQQVDLELKNKIAAGGVGASELQSQLDKLKKREEEFQRSQPVIYQAQIPLMEVKAVDADLDADEKTAEQEVEKFVGREKLAELSSKYGEEAAQKFNALLNQVDVKLGQTKSRSQKYRNMYINYYLLWRKTSSEKSEIENKYNAEVSKINATIKDLETKIKDPKECGYTWDSAVCKKWKLDLYQTRKTKTEIESKYKLLISDYTRREKTLEKHVKGIEEKLLSMGYSSDSLLKLAKDMKSVEFGNMIIAEITHGYNDIDKRRKQLGEYFAETQRLYNGYRAASDKFKEEYKTSKPKTDYWDIVKRRFQVMARDKTYNTELNLVNDNEKKIAQLEEAFLKRRELNEDVPDRKSLPKLNTLMNDLPSHADAQPSMVEWTTRIKKGRYYNDASDLNIYVLGYDPNNQIPLPSVSGIIATDTKPVEEFKLKKEGKDEEADKDDEGDDFSTIPPELLAELAKAREEMEK